MTTQTTPTPGYITIETSAARESARIVENALRLAREMTAPRILGEAIAPNPAISPIVDAMRTTVDELAATVRAARLAAKNCEVDPANKTAHYTAAAQARARSHVLWLQIVAHDDAIRRTMTD